MFSPIFFILSKIYSLSLFSFNIQSFAKHLYAAQNSTIKPIEYLLTQIHVITTYIVLFFFPVNQNFDYDFAVRHSILEPQTLFLALALCTFIVIGILLRKKSPLVSFGIFFFFAALSVESTILPIRDVIAEHRMYLPSLGLILIVCAIVSYLWNITPKHNLYTKFILISIVISLLSCLTIQRNNIWKTNTSLWQDVVTKSPNKARGHFFYAQSLFQEKEYSEAQQEFMKAMQLNHSYVSAIQPLAIYYMRSGKHFEALSVVKKAQKVSPESKYLQRLKERILENQLVGK